MKKCHKCGALQDDKKMFCIDCGEKLDASNVISSYMQKEILNQTDQLVDKLNPDGLTVNAFDKVMVILNIVGIVACLVAAIISLIVSKDMSLFGYSFLTMLFFVVSIVLCRFPKVDWAIRKALLSFTVKKVDDLSPSGFYVVMRRLSSILCFLIGSLYVVLIIYSTSPKALINNEEFPNIMDNHGQSSVIYDEEFFKSDSNN